MFGQLRPKHKSLLFAQPFSYLVGQLLYYRSLVLRSFGRMLLLKVTKDIFKPSQAFT